jgi:hypothetical protein
MADKVDLGLGANVRKKAADGLAEVLADHSLLALKSRSFHWNLTGPNFQGPAHLVWYPVRCAACRGRQARRAHLCLGVPGASMPRSHIG